MIGEHEQLLQADDVGKAYSFVSRLADRFVAAASEAPQVLLNAKCDYIGGIILCTDIIGDSRETYRLNERYGEHLADILAERKQVDERLEPHRVAHYTDSDWHIITTLVTSSIVSSGGIPLRGSFEPLVVLEALASETSHVIIGYPITRLGA
jgi:hypothetical protein